MPELELRVANGGDRTGNLLVAMTLPDGEDLRWDPPVSSEKLPGGVGPVELYVDGRFVAYGIWPNLQPVPNA